MKNLKELSLHYEFLRLLDESFFMLQIESLKILNLEINDNFKNEYLDSLIGDTKNHLLILNITHWDSKNEFLF